MTEMGRRISTHHETHQSDGSDEINVQDLAGVLSDEQDAGKIKGVTVDDSAKSDGLALVYDAATETIIYASISFFTLDLFDPSHLITNLIEVSLGHAIT